MMKKQQLRLECPIACFLAGFLLITGNSARAATGYKLDVIPSLGGSAQARDLNNLSQVVGVAHFPDGSGRAFLWSAASGTTNLGTLPGDTFSGALAINDAGQVIGISQDASVPGPAHAFVWQSATGLSQVGPAFVGSVYTHSINAQGQMVGSAWTGSPSQLPFGFISVGTALTPVAQSGVTVTEVYAINDQGQMAVRSADSETVLFISPGSSPVEIHGTGNLSGGAVLSINDSGTAVGYIDPSNGDNPHAYAWNQATGFTDFGVGMATDINSFGQVVGNDESGAFFWDNGTSYDLQGLLDASGDGWSNLSPQAINDIGQITGYGTFDGQVEAFLLTPTSLETASSIPEPATLSLLALATLPLLLRRRWYGR